MRLATLLVLTTNLWAQPPREDYSFSGGIERVMEHSVSILLSDGRLIDAKLPDKGRLSGATLSDTYRLGDQVMIHCRAIKRVWDDESMIGRVLELDSLKLRRKPTSEELAAAAKNRDWRLPGNLLHAPAGMKSEPQPEAPAPENVSAASGNQNPDPKQFLDFARNTILQHAAHLPDFIADETADCSFTRVNPPDWQHRATVEYEVTFQGSGEKRKGRTLNGKPFSSPDIPTGCMGWGGGFGTYMVPVFDPRCGATIEFAKKIAGAVHVYYVYKYKSPPEGCFLSSFTGYQRSYPAHEGLVSIAYPGGDLIEVKDRSLDFPKAYPILQRDETVTWGFVRIDNTLHLLPLEFEKLMLFQGQINRVTAKYGNHRHFEANSTVTFQ